MIEESKELKEYYIEEYLYRNNLSDYCHNILIAVNSDELKQYLMRIFKVKSETKLLSKIKNYYPEIFI